LNRRFTMIDLSEEYVEASRTRIAEAEGLPVEGAGLPNWPEHADAELRWLYSENNVPLRQLAANRMLLSLLTSKLNARLQKIRPYTPEEVDERLDLLDRSGKLSPLDKASGPQTGALILEE